MAKHRRHKRNLMTTTVRFVLVTLLLAATSYAQKTPGSVKPNVSSQSAIVTAALKASFGSTVEPDTIFKPFYLTGDFNGDGVQDLIAIVRVKARRNAFAKDVRLVNPFDPGGKLNFPANLTGENNRAFVIIHSWKNSSVGGKFLLIGEAPLLILQYETSYGPDAARDQMELMKRSGPRRRGQRLPRNSKGDVIILGSQVGDSMLYWNGRTYVWEDSPDD